MHNDTPAFPSRFVYSVPAGSTPADQAESGMSLRDYFAAQALAGISALDDYRTLPKGRTDLAAWRAEEAAKDAEWCWIMADAMLKQREGKRE